MLAVINRYLEELSLPFSNSFNKYYNFKLKYLKPWMKSDYFIALIFLCIYMLTNNYVFASDDQHLEVPLLKKLIDPTLYPGDYYVESLKRNFTSYVYPLLSKFITTQQVSTAYFILFLVVRYLMFYWIYKIFKYLFKDGFTSFCAVMMFLVLGRTDEFLYRTFSHQEVGFVFMFAGIYFFYKENFLLSALILGIGVNFHAIFNLFPILYLTGYLLLFHQLRIKNIIYSSIIFVIAALPFLCWQIPKSINDKLISLPIPTVEWLPLYFKSCPQNFFFYDRSFLEAIKNPIYFITQLDPYVYLLILYLFLRFSFKEFREDIKTQTILLVSFILLVVSFVFSEFIPNRFMIDLNLIRNGYTIKFLLLGYFTYWIIKSSKEGKPCEVLYKSLAFFVFSFGSFAAIPGKLKKYFIVIPLISFVYLMLKNKSFDKFNQLLRKSFIIICLLIPFISFTSYNIYYYYVSSKGMGFFQFQREWIDIQNFTRLNTPKNALILTPIDTPLGGFRIFSERKVLVCNRDCGIVGFDFQAFKEWVRRQDDVKGFTLDPSNNVREYAVAAINKYNVDYIVFIKFYEPPPTNRFFTKLYENSIFSIFKVNYQNSG